VSRSGVVLSPHAANLARDGAFRRDHDGSFGDKLFNAGRSLANFVGLGCVQGCSLCVELARIPGRVCLTSVSAAGISDGDRYCGNPSGDL
jgi:hypothetical protein